MKQPQAMPMIDQRRRKTIPPEESHHSFPENAPAQPPVARLVSRLCEALETEGITYCHWKSNNALERSACGDNDLDLLVSRAETSRFIEIMGRLGFKPATAPLQRQTPGIVDYFGYDEATDKWIHVHTHYQLILGHDMTKNYRLPIEEPYLDSVVRDDLFRIPAPDFEFVVFVIRMTLKHSTWDAVLTREGTLKAAEKQELAHLQLLIDQERVHDILRSYLPYIEIELFESCIRALERDCPVWERIRIGHRLQNSLRANARRPGPVDLYLKLQRRAILMISRRLFKSSPKYCLQNGGAMVAIVGGDGAGKSTAVDALYSWLSKDFQTTTIHLGKPTWSWLTIAVRGTLKIGNRLGLYPVDSSFRETLEQQSLLSPGYPYLLREVCRSRDRYRTYVRARRIAANGSLVLLDRFPLPQIQLMDGPLAARFISRLAASPHARGLMRPHHGSRLARALVKLDERYYDQFVPPELLIVLRVDPEVAVQRKTEEDAVSVRERSTEIWNLHWEDTHAHVLDGSKSKADVAAQLKALLWSQL